MRSIFLLVGFAVACSGGRGGGGGEPDRPRGSATPDTPVTASGPTDKECEAMIAHVAELGAGDTISDPPPTPDERKLVAAQLTPQFLPGCRASSRAGYRCAMEAKTLAELERCKPK